MSVAPQDRFAMTMLPDFVPSNLTWGERSKLSSRDTSPFRLTMSKTQEQQRLPLQILPRSKPLDRLFAMESERLESDQLHQQPIAQFPKEPPSNTLEELPRHCRIDPELPSIRPGQQAEHLRLFRPQSESSLTRGTTTPLSKSQLSNCESLTTRCLVEIRILLRQPRLSSTRKIRS